MKDFTFFRLLLPDLSFWGGIILGLKASVLIILILRLDYDETTWMKFFQLRSFGRATGLKVGLFIVNSELLSNNPDC